MSKQRLAKIRSFYQKNRRLPSYTEMLDLFSLSSKNSIHKIMQNWLDEGLVEKNDDRFVPTSRFFHVPLVGEVRAGFPTQAYEDPQLISIDEYLIRQPNSSFLLQVDGDSLHGIGILENDLVLMERTKEARPGDIVLACIDEEWTLKIFRRDGSRTYLEAANDNYPPFYPEEELEIFGIVKGVVRKIN